VYFTGLTNTLERVSPRVIALNPPEKLVIETRSSGGYQLIDWLRNGNTFGSSGFPVTPQEFPNFFETFVREPTTMDDLGVYVADLQIAVGQSQIPDVQFFVTRYGKDQNTSIYHVHMTFSGYKRQSHPPTFAFFFPTVNYYVHVQACRHDTFAVQVKYTDIILGIFFHSHNWESCGKLA